MPAISRREQLQAELEALETVNDLKFPMSEKIL